MFGPDGDTFRKCHFTWKETHSRTALWKEHKGAQTAQKCRVFMWCGETV